MSDLHTSGGFPVADRPTRAAAETVPRVQVLTPGDDVPARRAELRAVVGDADVPMVELDADGTVLFVGGDWESVVGFTKPGPAPVQVLLQGVVDPDQVRLAITNALTQRTPSVFAFGSEGLHYLKVQPIPSATKAGAIHVLVGLSADAELEQRAVAPSSARHTIDAIPEPAPRRVMSAAATPVDAAMAATKSGVTPSALAPPGPDSQSLHQPAGATPTSTAPAPPAGPSPIDRASEWLSTRFSGDALRGIPPLDWLGAVMVVLVAFFLRARGLETVPAGMHGDEAITGFEAQRILNEGSIGVYTGSALGQPTLPFYLSAISVGLFGPTVWAVRIVSAIAGAATVALVWFVARRRFDQATAIASSFALATLTWSLHFSRIAFGVAWWPFVVFLAAALIDRAARTNTWQAWAAAGATAGIGVYVYNSHWFFGVTVLMFMIVWLIRQLIARTPITELVPVLAGGAGALVVLAPMLRYMADDNNAYFNHFNLVSRRTEPEWTESGLFGKIGAQLSWYRDSWDVLLFSNVNDGADASGIIRMVPVLFILLGVIGFVALLARHRTWFSAFVLIAVVMTPLGASMTRDGLTRRNYSLAPFLAILAGVGAVVLWRAIRRVSPSGGRWAAGFLAVAMMWTSVVPYFTDFRNDGGQKWVFSEELTLIADVINDAEDDGPVFVNWYSPRHYYDYSTLDFLVDAPGINRAPVDQGLIEMPSIERTPDIPTDQLYIFVGDYANELERLRTEFPDGRVLMDRQGPRVVVYRIPG